MTKFPLIASPIVLMAALMAASSLSAQELPKKEYPSPDAIVDAAPASDWKAIAASDLLVMDLAPDAKGPNTKAEPRRVVIQLMPPPFSQGWIGNIRKLAAAKFWDGTSINRVQDNYVVQWGDAGYDNPESGETEQKALPDDLVEVPESEYEVDADTLSDFTSLQKKVEPDPEKEARISALMQNAADPSLTEQQHLQAIDDMMKIVGLAPNGEPTSDEQIALISIESTQTHLTSQGWHERDGYTPWVELWKGWPLGNLEKFTWENEFGKPVPRPLNTQRHVLEKQNIYKQVEESHFWPIHCYGAVGVGRNLSPDTGTGAELYTVIGHAPRHLDRNIAVVGRIIEGMEHLSSLPRGKGQLGFYADASKRVPIQSIRLGTSLAAAEQPQFEYLDTDSEAFARYASARANRRDPFFIKPSGGADICNFPVPVRRVKAE